MEYLQRVHCHFHFPFAKNSVPFDGSQQYPFRDFRLETNADGILEYGRLGPG